MTIKGIRAVVGSVLSNTSKMPCSSFNLSAAHCITGRKLAEVIGSVCEGCYAMDGFYKMYGHIERMKPKTALIQGAQWVRAMVQLITNQNKGDKAYFRWHDSGDLQSLNHLIKIVEVCTLTPGVKHWLPTREYKIIKDYIKVHGIFPGNLTVRLSAHMIDQAPPLIKGTAGSAVNDQRPPQGLLCPAPTQNNKCMTCRACWNKETPLVSYTKH